jgi:hypothetical protein
MGTLLACAFEERRPGGAQRGLITRTDKLLRDADVAVHRLRRAMAEVERANLDWQKGRG